MSNNQKIWMSFNSLLGATAVTIALLNLAQPNTTDSADVVTEPPLTIAKTSSTSPTKEPLAKYDLSTPENAIKAKAKMFKNADIEALAQFNLYSQLNRPHNWVGDFKIVHKEKLNDLTVIFFEFTNKYNEKIKKVRTFYKQGDRYFENDTNIVFDLPEDHPLLEKALNFL